MKTDAAYRFGIRSPTPPTRFYNGDTGDIACDHYHHWKEDVQLLKQLGVSAYRLSIAWSRILPQGRGAINEAGIQFYSDLVDELLANGITPLRDALSLGSAPSAGR